MKYTVGLVMAVAAISANAQAFNDLPDCGKTCVQNVMAKADEFGCEAGDAACLCQNVNFTYGIRDCSLQSCTDAAQAVINYGAEYCRNEGVVITTAGSDTKTGDSTDATATATVTGGSSDSDSDDDDDDAKSGVPIATSTYETVVEESGSSVTSTIVETIYSSSSADAAESTSDSTSDSTSEGDSKSATDKDSASKTESKKPTDTNGSNTGNDDDDNSDDDDANEGDDDSGVARAAPAGFLAVAAIAAFLV